MCSRRDPSGELWAPDSPVACWGSAGLKGLLWCNLLLQYDVIEINSETQRTFLWESPKKRTAAGWSLLYITQFTLWIYGCGVVWFSLTHLLHSHWPLCVSASFGPVTHSGYLLYDTSPEPKLLFVHCLPACYSTNPSLAHWGNTGDAGGEQVPIEDTGWQPLCMAHLWQTINQIAKSAKRKRDCLKGIYT